MRPVRRRPRAMMLGLRGVPGVQGGIERHVEELAPRLAARGWAVEVVARTAYVPHVRPRRWHGVVVTPLPAPRHRTLEAVVHSALGLLHAARRRPDVLHVHGIGPALVVPLARLLGLRTVVTHHGFDYDRAKWGRLARAALRLGEWAGMRFADHRVAVSRAIAAAMRARHGRPVAAIPNGVPIPTPRAGGEAGGRAVLDAFGLEPDRYVVMVSRLVPEKRHLDLIRAFARAGLPGWRLAIVGSADHLDGYARHVLGEAAATAGVVATGFQTGARLDALLAHAALFVLPSSHEGLPIALLEALAHGVPALASDIPANREIGLPAAAYVPVGDVDALAEGLRRAYLLPASADERAALRALVRRDHDWEVIADRTLAAYESLLADAARVGRTANRHSPMPAPERAEHDPLVGP